jgi:hypothetical protein
VERLVVFSLTSALNPTLLAAATLMLLLPNPRRLMLGYLLGAYVMSITLGCVIVFALGPNSRTADTAQHQLSPAADLVLGALALLVAYVLATGRDRRVRDRRSRTDRPEKAPPRWKSTLSGGSFRTTFVVGALLTLPGASYLAGLHQLHLLDYPTAGTVVCIVAMNVVMLALLEVPLLCYTFAPDWTPGAIERGKSWIARRGRTVAVRGLGLLGVLLVIKGVAGLIA